MSHIFSRSFWIVFDFAENLGLGNKGLNGHKEITVSLISDDEITSVFSVRQPDGWKVNINEFVIIKDYESCMKMFTHIFLPTVITQMFFLRGWLVQRKGIE